MSKHRDYRGAGVVSGVLSISRQARVAADANRAALWVSTVLTVLATLLTAFSAQARSAPESFADLAARLLPSVVNISTTQTVSGNAGPQMPHVPPGSPFEEFFKEFFDRNWQAPQRKRRVTSLGSGFIIDAAKGYVVTNNHVIADADEITVILHDDTRLAAKLVGRDQKIRSGRLTGRTRRFEAETLGLRGLGRHSSRRLGDRHRQPLRSWRVRDGRYRLRPRARHSLGEL